MITLRGSLGVKGLDSIRIKGGSSLCGSVSIQGSKNAALPMMAASLLHRGVSVLKGCPRILDVFCMEQILRELGAITWWEGHDLYMDCTNADKTEVSGIYTKKMRSSVILLGAMLGRGGKGCLGYPGGCVIGKRPIDLHLHVLRGLGAKIEETAHFLCASADELLGAEITFGKKSVGATEQGILGAVLAKGQTCLNNCAKEPEILWLCRYLKGMGAKISGEGESCIRITGVDYLNGGNMQVPPDRIVAGTYLCACAATRGRIIIENPPEGELDAFLEVYRKIGGQYKAKSGKLIADGSGVCRPLYFLETEAYPGFPTDLQSPLMTVLTTVPGKSHIREKIFEDRFKAAVQLNKMGAKITVTGKDAWIQGGNKLRGCTVFAEELRGGAALMLAALVAEGETDIQGYSYICRGYEHIGKDLVSLGGSIIKDTGIDLYESIKLQKEIAY